MSLLNTLRLPSFQAISTVQLLLGIIGGKGSLLRPNAVTRWRERHCILVNPSIPLPAIAIAGAHLGSRPNDFRKALI